MCYTNENIEIGNNKFVSTQHKSKKVKNNASTFEKWWIEYFLSVFREKKTFVIFVEYFLYQVER